MKIEERIELRLNDIGEKLAEDLNRDDYKKWRISDIATLRLEAKWLLSYVRQLRERLTPKMPENIHGWAGDTVGRCKVCNEAVFKSAGNYCPRCGSAIEWLD